MVPVLTSVAPSYVQVALTVPLTCSEPPLALTVAVADSVQLFGKGKSKVSVEPLLVPLTAVELPAELLVTLTAGIV